MSAIHSRFTPAIDINSPSTSHFFSFSAYIYSIEDDDGMREWNKYTREKEIWKNLSKIFFIFVSQTFVFLHFNILFRKERGRREKLRISRLSACLSPFCQTCVTFSFRNMMWHYIVSCLTRISPLSSWRLNFKLFLETNIWGVEDFVCESDTHVKFELFKRL